MTPSNKPRTKLIRAVLAGLIGAAATPAVATESAYDFTYKLCRDHARVGLTNLERVIYAVTYLYRREAGETLFPEARVRLADPGIVLRNAKAVALDLNFAPDQELRALVRSPEFYRALADCFPDTTYPNAARLRGAFVVELLGLEATGKGLGLGAWVVTGEAVGVGLKSLRAVSTRAHAWAVRAMTGVALGGPVAQVVADEIERRRVEELLPKHRAARAAGLDADGRAAALGADLNDLARASGRSLDVQTRELDAEMDRVIEDLRARLSRTNDSDQRLTLERKIQVLEDAR